MILSRSFRGFRLLRNLSLHLKINRVRFKSKISSCLLNWYFFLMLPKFVLNNPISDENWEKFPRNCWRNYRKCRRIPQTILREFLKNLLRKAFPAKIRNSITRRIPQKIVIKKNRRNFRGGFSKKRNKTLKKHGNIPENYAVKLQQNFPNKLPFNFFKKFWINLQRISN